MIPNFFDKFKLKFMKIQFLKIGIDNNGFISENTLKWTIEMNYMYIYYLVFWQIANIKGHITKKVLRKNILNITNISLLKKIIWNNIIIT